MFIVSVILNCVFLVVILRLWAQLRSKTEVHKEVVYRAEREIDKLTRRLDRVLPGWQMDE